MEITLKEVEATKLDLKPGDVLAVTIKDDDVNFESMRDFDESLKKFFPNNKVALFVLGTGNDIRFTIMSDAQNQGCGTQSYCNDCTCGKKEQMENKGE